MAKLGSRREQRRSNEIILIVLALLVVLVVVVGTAYFIMTRAEGLDKKTLCPAKGPIGHYVLLIDKTDPLTFTQNEAFAVMLRELVEKRIPEGYLLSVFSLGEDFKETAKPLAELCNPGSGKDKSELTSNKTQLKRQYQDRFIDPLLKQSASLVGLQSAKQSPIFEMLQMVGINAFRKHDVKGEKRLIILSDMLHNTTQFSMYKGLVEYSEFTASPYGQKAQPDLHGVEVEINYLINTPQLQTKRNLKFWEDYFNKAGARIVAVRPMEG